jgi:hypothetical protein
MARKLNPTTTADAPTPTRETFLRLVLTPDELRALGLAEEEERRAPVGGRCSAATLLNLVGDELEEAFGRKIVRVEDGLDLEFDDWSYTIDFDGASWSICWMGRFGDVVRDHYARLATGVPDDMSELRAMGPREVARRIATSILVFEKVVDMSR